MKKISGIICFFVICAFQVHSQNYYNQFYPIQYSQVLEGTCYHNGFIYSWGRDYNYPSGGLCVYKFDALNGDLIIQKCYTDSAGSYYSTKGGIYKADSTLFIMPFSRSTSNAMIMKIDENGDSLFTKEVYSAQNNYWWDGIVTTDSALLMVGNIENPPGQSDAWMCKMDFDGNIIWQESFHLNVDDGARGVTETPEGDYIITGYTSSNVNPPDNEMLVMKYSKNGIYKWHTLLNGIGNFTTNGTPVVLNNGDIFITGQVDINDDILFWEYDFYFTKLDSSGNEIWQKSFGYFPPGMLTAESCQHSMFVGDGLCAFCSAQSPIDSVNTIVLLYLDTAANVMSKREIRGFNEVLYLSRMTRLPNGDIAFTGQLQGGNGYDANAWLVRVDSMGCFSPGCWLDVEETELSNEFLRLKLYPNPAGSVVHAQIEFGDDTETATLSIYDATGRLTHSHTINGKSHELMINVSEFESGIYQVMLSTNDGRKAVQRLSVLR